MFFIFLESILSKLQKIPGLYIHSCKSVFGYFLYIIFLFYLFIIFDFFFILVFSLLNQLGYIFAYCFTELEGKDVEDLFTAVLSPSTNPPPPPPQVPHPQGPGPFPTAPGNRMPHHNTGTSLLLFLLLLFLRDGTFSVALVNLFKTCSFLIV